MSNVCKKRLLILGVSIVAMLAIPKLLLAIVALLAFAAAWFAVEKAGHERRAHQATAHKLAFQRERANTYRKLAGLEHEQYEGSVVSPARQLRSAAWQITPADYEAAHRAAAA